MEVQAFGLATIDPETIADAPYDLSDAAAAVWRATMAALPADFVAPESFDLLSSYCRHVATAAFISREIDRFEISWLTVDGGIERLNKLTAMRDREARGMLATARALRITNQSRYRPEKALNMAKQPRKGIPRPWEDK